VIKLKLKVMSIVLLCFVAFCFVPRVFALIGDVNGDGKVDIYDAVLLASSFGSTPSSPRWNPGADLNGNGVVDIYDTLILANNFGK
jgi:hypothetical protein